MIDLHVHSTYSDGTLTPKELVDLAIVKNLSVMALTDHDSVNGIDEILSYAASLPNAPKIVPGVELSTEYEGREVHVVGLFIDHKHPEFTAYLKDFIDSRTTRNIKMCKSLTDAGIEITYQELLDAFPDAVITRAHYAKLMIQKGYIKSINEAFERYVGDHCPYYVPREKVTPQDAIRLIKKAGGIPIFAHPILCRFSDSRLENLVAELKASGLMGIEAVYSTYTPSEERQVRALAAKHDLLLSGGSDFHGSNKPKIDLGVGYGKLCVPDEFYEKMLEVM